MVKISDKKLKKLARMHQSFDLLLWVIIEDSKNIKHFNKFNKTLVKARNIMYSSEKELVHGKNPRKK
jgi:hypothetical protein